MTDQTLYKQYAIVYRHAREGVSLTQEKAAAQLGISVRYLQYIEAGDRVPRIDLVSKRADVYRCGFLCFKFNVSRNEKKEGKEEHVPVPAD